LPRRRYSPTRVVITAFGLAAVAAILVTMALSPLFFAPPAISVRSAYLSLTPAGYQLVVELSVDREAKLEYVELPGGRVLPWVEVLRPPASTVSLYVPEAAETYKLHFSSGAPVQVVVKPPRLSAELRPAFMGRDLYLVGVLPSKASVLVVEVPPRPTALVGPSEYLYAAYNDPMRIYDVVYTRNLNSTDLSKYGSVVFAGVLPSQRLLQALGARAAVVFVKGSLDYYLDYNSTSGEYYLRPAGREAAASLLGGECAYSGEERASFSDKGAEEALKSIRSELYVKAFGGIRRTPACLQGVRAVAYNGLGDPALFERGGLYISFLSPEDTATYMAAGLYSPATHRAELLPFSGYRYAATVKRQDAAVLVVLDTGGAKSLLRASPPPSGFALSGGSYLVDIPAYSGFTVSEYSPDGTLVATWSGEAGPTPRVLELNASGFYVIDFGGRPLLVARRPPDPGQVSVSGAGVYELCEQVITRRGGSGRLSVYVDGLFYGYIDPDSEVRVGHCLPGLNTVQLRDPYFGVVASFEVRVQRIYETPFFFLSVLAAAAIGSAIYSTARRRTASRRVPVAYYVLEREEEAAPPTADAEQLVAVYESSKRASPVFEELVEMLAQRYQAAEASLPVLVRSAASAIREGRLRTYTLYSPELLDTYTVISKDLDPASQAFMRVLCRLASRLAVACSPADPEVANADAVLSHGSSMLFVYFYPGGPDPRRTVARAFADFVEYISERQTMYRYMGFAVLSYSWSAATAIKSSIRRVIAYDASEAAKVFARDMRVFEYLQKASKSAPEWLSAYFMASMPVSQVLPVVAYFKLSDPRAYHRFEDAAHAQRLARWASTART